MFRILIDLYDFHLSRLSSSSFSSFDARVQAAAKRQSEIPFLLWEFVDDHQP